MKIGIIGAGNIAGTMATTLQQMKGTECYAIASRDIKRASGFADKYGFERAYGSYADMLNDPYVELVYIATPHSHHYEHIKMCLNHGKHVLCEKAFCANAKQAAEVMLIAEDMGLLLAEAMWTRYMPMRGLINKVLKSGIIGNPTSLSANLGYPLINKPRLVRPELAGGALLDLGVYVLNFASMVFGDGIDSIAANCVKLDTGVDAQENIMLTYHDGKMASLYVTMLAQTDRRGLINGTNGYIEIENINNYEMVRVFNLERKIVAEYTAPTQITGYEYEVQSVMRAIREGRIECPEMPHAEILRMMQLMDSIRSAWNIEFPFEMDNTIRITADDLNPDVVHEMSAAKDAVPRKQESVVRKISEKSVSDTEYENTKKPKAKNAKDARDKLPTSQHKGITDKLPKDLDFAAPDNEQENKGFVNKKLESVPTLKKPEPEPQTEPAEEAVVEQLEQLKKKKKKKPEPETGQDEYDIFDAGVLDETMHAEEVIRDKSPTEQIRDMELGVTSAGAHGKPGSVTDQIRGLVIEEETDPRTVTGKIRDLDIPIEDKGSEFQRRRKEPSVKAAEKRQF
ncbi:MAG: Gfo/Idh/MocA family oxidoreductase [Lachnospiraceae bacterium]|nr:Gfo/Idh/MocA family oxidoreductase [Lachnospiraceae bacterium]